MPRLAPLQKLLRTLKRKKDQHRERHRPSGFGLALADSIAYLPANHWEALAAPGSFFLSRSYLNEMQIPRFARNDLPLSFSAPC